MGMDIKDFLDKAIPKQSQTKDKFAIDKGLEEISAINKAYAEFQHAIKGYGITQFVANGLIYLLDSISDVELLLKECPEPDNTDESRAKRKLRARMLSELYQKYNQ